MTGATPAGPTIRRPPASIASDPGGTSGSGTCLIVTTTRTLTPRDRRRQQLADVADRQLVEEPLRPGPVLEHHDAVRAGGRDRARLGFGGLPVLHHDARGRG